MAASVMAALGSGGRQKEVAAWSPHKTPTARGRFSELSLSEQYLRVLEQAFVVIDEDQSGSLSKRELRNVWRIIFPDMSERELQQFSDDVWLDLDPNGDGHVMLYEIEAFFSGEGRLAPGTRRIASGEVTEVDRMLQENCISRAPTCREAVWAVVASGDAPRYSPAPVWLGPVAAGCFILSNLAILMSIGNFIIESLPRNYATVTDRQSVSFSLEASCIAVFTLEFCVRAATTPCQRSFWSSFFTWVDVLAIIPFYINIISDISAGPLVVLRVLRLLRLLRMLKLGRHFEAVQVLVIAINRTMIPLFVSMFGVNLVAIILFASLVASAERFQAHFDHDLRVWVRNNDSEYDDSGQKILFQSVPEAMWWAWVTLTTVGYGDMFPVTGPGRAVASLTMCCGLVLMAFPLTLLASSFADVADELRCKKLAKARCNQFQRRLECNAASISTVQQALKVTMGGEAVRLGGGAQRASQPAMIGTTPPGSPGLVRVLPGSPAATSPRTRSVQQTVRSVLSTTASMRVMPPLHTTAEGKDGDLSRGLSATVPTRAGTQFSGVFDASAKQESSEDVGRSPLVPRALLHGPPHQQRDSGSRDCPPAHEKDPQPGSAIPRRKSYQMLPDASPPNQPRSSPASLSEPGDPRLYDMREAGQPDVQNNGRCPPAEERGGGGEYGPRLRRVEEASQRLEAAVAALTKQAADAFARQDLAVQRLSEQVAQLACARTPPAPGPLPAADDGTPRADERRVPPPGRRSRNSDPASAASPTAGDAAGGDAGSQRRRRRRYHQQQGGSDGRRDTV